ncbi:MAG: type 4a pilus biogenesis protein PilO [Pseudobdellovibrio sp.]|uniref:type 4a pilus biogenesis protein PilO n=1 Tax=Pseudobdellovibrio sp. HCB154 TaxID=3386277 RepID=UPI00391734AE|nr:type 4a pilus biogenesis protein PilO [Pseudobdellovibrio sp.]
MNELMAKVSTLSVNRIAIFGFILTMVYFFTMYNNGDALLAEIQGLQAQITEETAKKVETERVLKKEEEMRADVASLAKTYEAVKSKIPIDFETSELRIIVEQVSAATDLKIAKLSNSDPQQINSPEATQNAEEANLVQKVAINYVFQGSFAQLNNFMTQIGGMEKIIKISELKIKAENGTDGPNKNLTVEAVLIGYRQAAVAAAKTPALPGAAPKEEMK